MFKCYEHNLFFLHCTLYPASFLLPVLQSRIQAYQGNLRLNLGFSFKNFYIRVVTYVADLIC